jgi:hypothetical protein
MNLSPKQQLKLHLHECCAHEGFSNLNAWICQGRFKHIDRSLASVLDPVCTMCRFSKARRRSHLCHTQGILPLLIKHRVRV